MKKLNYIILIFSLLIIPLLGQFAVSAETANSNNENEIKRNINEIDDITKVVVSEFRWKQKTKGIPGIFDYVEINNKLTVDIKDVRIEVLAYDSKGILYKFLIPIKGEIRGNSKKRFYSILTPILNLFPEETMVNVESAKLSYQSDNLKIKAKNAIKINNFDYIVENIASETVQVKELDFINESSNYFKDIVFSIEFYDEKNKLINSVPFKVRGVIGPKEKKVAKNFQIPGINIKYFSEVKLSVFKGDLIDAKEYISEGGDSKLVDESNLRDSRALPRKDIKINDFKIINKSKNTIGLINIDLTNRSRFKYENIVLSVGFENKSGNTFTSKKIRIKDILLPYSTKNFINAEFGLVDNDFAKINLAILSADMIGSVKEVKKSKPNNMIKNKRITKDLKAFKGNNELIILNSNLGTLTSVRVLNVSVNKIFNPVFEIKLLDENSKNLKTLLIKGEGPIDSKKERTYRSIKIQDFNSYEYVNYTIEFISGEKLK